MAGARRGKKLAQDSGKHTPYFELVDAQKLAGCPICRLIYKAADRYLDGILYEAVLDPSVRTKLKRSRGFCAQHVEVLSRKPGRALGIALIYRDTIRALADIAAQGHFEHDDSLARKLRRRAPGGRALAEKLAAEQSCPACTVGHDAERTYVGLLLTHLRDDELLYRAYAEGEGLCLPHLLHALEGVSDDETFTRLVQPQVARYRLMLDDLDEFIRKRDYRFREEKYGDEGDVWLRAMNAVVGGAGLGLSAKTGGRRSLDIDNPRR
jgi:hypothetical protein